MAKKYKIGQSALVKKLKMITEDTSYKPEDFDEIDYLDAFIYLFRNWVSNKLGEDAKKMPFSLLLREYGEKFLKDSLGDKFKGLVNNRELSFSKFGLIELGRKLIEADAHKLPSLRSEQKFTEKFKKQIPFFVERLGLPEWVTLEFIESSPYYLHIVIHIDFEPFLKSEIKIDRGKIQTELSDYFKNFLGVNFQRASHGGLQLTSTVSLDGVDEWVTNVLNKKIKKDIKKMPFGHYIRSIRFEPSDYFQSHLNLYYKEGMRYEPGMSQWSIFLQIQNYINDLGYKKLSVNNA